MPISKTTHIRGRRERARGALRRWMPAVALLCVLLPAAHAQQRPRPEAPPEPAAAQPAPPVIANICPRFVLQGVPRRIKFYGAYFADPQFEYEGEELAFRDFRVDPDARSFSVTVEAKREAASGRRQFKLLGQSAESREVVFYVLKPQDRALLQRDLVRCPGMKDEVEVPADKQPPRRPAKPPQ